VTIAHPFTLEVVMTLMLSIPALSQDRRIPDRFSRDGENISPPIMWQGAPVGTRSYALVVEDPDAPRGTFRHWAAYNIPAGADGLTEGAGADEADSMMRMAMNDFGNRRYDGPQPPPGHGTHHYHFRLFALDTQQLPVPATGNAGDVLDVARAHALAEADLVGTFER
jgi:Raf kinase inhibitor-like YbhB/YbcL family protein